VRPICSDVNTSVRHTSLLGRIYILDPAFLNSREPPSDNRETPENVSALFHITGDTFLPSLLSSELDLQVAGLKL